MRITLTVALTIALLFAACSSDTESQSTDTAAPTTPEIPAPTETPESASESADSAPAESASESADSAPAESASESAPVEPESTEAATATEAAADTDAQAERAPTDRQPATPTAGGFSLNGFRYCEILMTVEGDDGQPVTQVWGTPGVGPCEDDAWYALDPDALMVEFSASSIHLNGPRYFTTDGSIDTAPEPTTPTETGVRSFGEVPMRLLATVGEATSETSPYDPGLVVRTATWAFNAGTEVYELTDPDGSTYLMQSYALIQDPTLSADDLAGLGDRLDLPVGWSYTARILDEDLLLELSPDGAIVVQDELENSYQQHIVAIGSDRTGAASDETAASADRTACDATATVLRTSNGVDFVRTPDACFDGLPDWPYEPRYVEIDGLRQAYVDEGPGTGPVVLLLHGEPSWSYLYRDMIPVFVDAGYRVVAMDHVGMGRSDKPTDIDDYSYLGHGERLKRFIDDLALDEINLFVQDWGSLIGLKVAGENPELFATITVGNGNLPVVPDGFTPFPPVENPGELRDLESPFASIPHQQTPAYDGCELVDPPPADEFANWMAYSLTGESFTASDVVEALTWYELTPEERAAYDAPFPDRIYLAGARVFPSLVNQLGGTTSDAWAGLQNYDKPFLTLWASNDTGSLGSCETQQRLIDNIPGAANQPHDRLEESSHFLQDDQGTEIATRMVAWLAGL